MTIASVPKCPKCGRLMRLASWRPAQQGCAAMQGFKCDPCAAEVTKEAS